MKNLFSLICGFRIPDSGFSIPDSGFWIPIPDSSFRFPGFRVAPYRLSQMIEGSFQHKLSAFFLLLVNSSSSKDVHSRTLYTEI